MLVTGALRSNCRRAEKPKAAAYTQKPTKRRFQVSGAGILASEVDIRSAAWERKIPSLRETGNILESLGWPEWGHLSCELPNNVPSMSDETSRPWDIVKTHQSRRLLTSHHQNRPPSPNNLTILYLSDSIPRKYWGKGQSPEVEQIIFLGRCTESRFSRS